MAKIVVEIDLKFITINEQFNIFFTLKSLVVIFILLLIDTLTNHFISTAFPQRGRKIRKFFLFPVSVSECFESILKPKKKIELKSIVVN